MEESLTSIFQRGADKGMVLGVYFCIMSVFMVAGESMPLFGLCSTVMMFGVPLVLYYFLRRTYVSQEGLSYQVNLWLEGVVIFACAGLILSFLIFCYLRWINPEFIPGQIDKMIDMYDSINDPRTHEMATLLRGIKDSRSYPSPHVFVAQLEVLIIASGLILSGIIAMLVRIRTIRKNEK